MRRAGNGSRFFGLVTGALLIGQVASAKDSELTVAVKKDPETGYLLSTVYGIVRAPVDEVWDYLREPDNLATLFRRVKKNRPIAPTLATATLRENSNDGKQMRKQLAAAPRAEVAFVGGEVKVGYLFREIRMPIFFKNRWYLARETHDPSFAELGNYTIRYERIAGTVKYLDGVWTLRSLAGDATNVSFSCTYDFGTKVPKAFYGMVRRSYKRALKNLKKAVEKKESS